MSRIAAILVPLAMIVAGVLHAQDAGEEKYEDLLRKMVGSLDQMSKTLEKIVDEDTAKANTMGLREEAATFIKARKQSQDLVPPSTDTRERLALKYRPQFEKTRKVLVGQIARVERVPGGNAALQEIRGVFEKNEP